MRCDFHPKGWLIIAGGADTHNMSSWSCKNATIDSDPQHCQWTPFWSPLPANASFAGQQMVDGRWAHRWDYWRNGEQWALWASLDGKSPVATGKVWTWHPTYHLFRILWRDFKPIPPARADFDLTPGIHCGPAPPPPPPPTPFKPATDCKPGCGASALCCQDPSSPPPGTCFHVKNCSSIHASITAAKVAATATTEALVRKHQPQTLEQIHAAANRRSKSFF